MASMLLNEIHALKGQTHIIDKYFNAKRFIDHV